ncbi:hypothetical protein EJ08DRAFT_604105 [Tothia fuscella]|uniref:Mitochondrial K+-H+ exchange-related-domain-containing protein n=1 Tax=Tothia fuscella TaxID=1048955 RepID=A0A9P4P1Y7_9PEZI|nr:hypothetical protein EJ08DRAFT_604105 [Tothia fuscella]
MRIFLLPISTRRTLIYCERAKQQLAPGEKPSWLDRATNKASETWVSFEKAESGWKKQLTTYGNAALRRIPYEEWGLKTLPPLSDTIRKKEPKKSVEVLFPGLFMKEEKVPDILRQLAIERQAMHKKRMIWSAIGAPLTLPFAAIPIIPNIPGFYLMFRAYSHFRALYGAKHLEFLGDQKLLTPMPSNALDEMYTAGLKYKTRQVARESPVPNREEGKEVAQLVEDQISSGKEDVMLLQRWNGKLLAERFKLPDMEVEIERAVEQVEKSLKAKEELAEEKREIEKATGAGAVDAESDSRSDAEKK